MFFFCFFSSYSDILTVKLCKYLQDFYEERKGYWENPIIVFAQLILEILSQAINIFYVLTFNHLETVWATSFFGSINLINFLPSFITSGNDETEIDEMTKNSRRRNRVRGIMVTSH